METLDIKWFETEGEVTLTTCVYCDGSGIKEVENGPDDIDHEFCTCACGQNAEHIAHNEMIAHAN